MIKNNLVKITEDWIINLNNVVNVSYDRSKDKTFVQFLDESDERVFSGKEVFKAIEAYSSKHILNEAKSNGNELD